MRAGPLGQPGLQCAAWRTDRWYRPLGVAPFLLTALHDIWPQHAKFLQETFGVRTSTACFPASNSGPNASPTGPTTTGTIPKTSPPSGTSPATSPAPPAKSSGPAALTISTRCPRPGCPRRSLWRRHRSSRGLRCEIGTSKRRRNGPHVFTERGTEVLWSVFLRGRAVSVKGHPRQAFVDAVGMPVLGSVEGIADRSEVYAGPSTTVRSSTRSSPFMSRT